MKVHRLTALVFVLALVVALPVFGQEQAQYHVILLGGKKVGHATTSRIVADGKVTTTQTMSVSFVRGGVPMTIASKEVNVETAEGRPVSFSAEQDMGIIKMRVEGAVDDKGKVSATLTSAAGKQTQALDWPEGALMSEGVRLLELKQGLKEGTTYGFKMFTATALQALPAEVRVGPTSELDLLGRVVKLTEVVTTVKGPLGKTTITSYLDKDLATQKSTMPLAGENLEVVACTKGVALAKNDLVDLLDRMLVDSPSPLDNLGGVGGMTYTLQSTGKEPLSLPASAGQTVTRKDQQVVVTVRPVKAPPGSAFPYTGTDKSALEALKPNRYLQSDNKEVLDLARQAVGDAKDAAQAIAWIEKFVRGYIRKKDLAVGYASAVEVVQARQGDCSEHAVLAAAMCRAAGIPAQVVCGLVYVPQAGGRKHVFGMHAWVQALAGDTWVGLDAALNGFDAGHIALAVGDGLPEDFFDLVSVLGYFKIVKAEVASR